MSVQLNAQDLSSLKSQLGLRGTRGKALQQALDRVYGGSIPTAPTSQDQDAFSEPLDDSLLHLGDEEPLDGDIQFEGENRLYSSSQAPAPSHPHGLPPGPGGDYFARHPQAARDGLIEVEALLTAQDPLGLPPSRSESRASSTTRERPEWNKSVKTAAVPSRAPPVRDVLKSSGPSPRKDFASSASQIPPIVDADVHFASPHDGLYSEYTLEVHRPGMDYPPPPTQEQKPATLSASDYRRKTSAVLESILQNSTAYPYSSASSGRSGLVPPRVAAQELIDEFNYYNAAASPRTDPVQIAMDRECQMLRNQLRNRDTEVQDLHERLMRMQKEYADRWLENQALLEGRNPPINRGSVLRNSTPTRARSVERGRLSQTAGSGGFSSLTSPMNLDNPSSSRSPAFVPGGAPGRGRAASGKYNQTMSTTPSPPASQGTRGRGRDAGEEALASGTKQAAMLLEPLMERIQKLHLELADRERMLGELAQQLRKEREERSTELSSLQSKLTELQSEKNALEQKCKVLSEEADHDRALRMTAGAEAERLRVQLEAAQRERETAVKDREEMLSRKNKADHRAERLQQQVEDLLGELERQKRERDAQTQSFASLENRMRVIRQRNERLGQQLNVEQETRRKMDMALMNKEEELGVLAAIIRAGGEVPLASSRLPPASSSRPGTSHSRGGNDRNVDTLNLDREREQQANWGGGSAAASPVLRPEDVQMQPPQSRPPPNMSLEEISDGRWSFMDQPGVGA